MIYNINVSNKRKGEIMVTKGRTNSIELHTHTHTSSSLLKNKKIEEVKNCKKSKIDKEASLKYKYFKLAFCT